MASSTLREELNCSICQEIYTEPVTLTCGHSFCLICITKTWDSQGDREGEYSCPECRDTYRRRPGIKRNLRLCNIVKCFHPNQSGEQDTGIFCTYCVHSPVPASKSCHLCETHLQVLSKSEEQVLTEPSASFGNRKCNVHKKFLEYYCCEDGACICVSCCLAEEHSGHQVKSVNEAFGEKMEKLSDFLQKLTLKRENTEKVLEDLQQQREEHKKATSVVDQITILFGDLKEQLAALESRVLSEIPKYEEQISNVFLDVTQQLGIEKDELSDKIHHTEELCKVTDPLTFLQAQKSSTYKCWEDEEAKMDTTMDDIDQILKSETLLTVFIDIVSMRSVNMETSSISKAQFVAGGEMEPQTPIDQTLVEDIKEMVELGLKYCNNPSDTSFPEPHLHKAPSLCLDECTAATNVNISYDRKLVTWSEVDLRNSHIERFQSGQVLSTNSFSSGHLYWDVETSNSGYWRIGVAYPGIQRRGKGYCIGDNKVSWCLYMLCGNYTVLHDGKEEDTCVMYTGNKTKRFRLFLDYEDGRLSFYQVMEQIKHVHTFYAAFKEPLHAAFWVSSGAW
ncbi:hypothetical protein GDO86_018570, partial [Hymenochirus boettgeri]